MWSLTIKTEMCNVIIDHKNWNPLGTQIGEKSGLPRWLSGKESACQHKRCGSIPGWRSPGEGNNSLQYSCLENPMDRGAWWAIVHGVAKDLDTTQQLNRQNYIQYEKKSIIIYTAVAWIREIARSMWVLLSKFKKLFFKWNPLKIQKLPLLYWPLETTDPAHTIKSEQCWNLLLLLANVSKKSLEENL